MPLPPLSPEDRAQGLAKARQARQDRAAVRADLKAGKRSLSEVLEAAQSDEALSKIKVHALLASLPGIGHAKAERVMRECNIAQSRRIRGLGYVQRQALISRFG